MERQRPFNLSPLKLLGLGVAAGAIIVLLLTGTYYASGSPKFCGSCHSMKLVYSRWQGTNHKQFACTECHLPDTNIVGKVAYKTRAGLNDLVHETFRAYPAAILLSSNSEEILKPNCIRCHYSTIENTPMARGGANCLKCHRYLGHGRGPEKGGIRVE
jgi:cytochrome c nitrite reductase small subunit